MNKPIQLAVVFGSTREGRLCDKVAAWVMGELKQRQDLRISLLDPRELETTDRRARETAIANVKRALDQADGFIVLTPEYNHSFAAPLKQLVDTAYGEWQAKPVGFVSYGGLAGGARAVEQLRQVFAELHAVTVRNSVSLINAWEQFGGDGELINPARANRALAKMLDQLTWWAQATRMARDARPYSGVA